MVYISSDGRVLQAKPWGLSTITDFFWGAIAFLQFFFTSLVSPDANKKGEGYTTDYRYEEKEPTKICCKYCKYNFHVRQCQAQNTFDPLTII